MQLIQINTEHDDDDFEALSHIVHEMQVINGTLVFYLFFFFHNYYLFIFVNEALFHNKLSPKACISNLSKKEK